MSDKPVKAGIVGLGRWAKVLTKASKKSKLLEIVAGYSRSEEKRTAFQQELGVPAVASMQAILADPEIQGVILTVPNEHHGFAGHDAQARRPGRIAIDRQIGVSDWLQF